MAELTAPMVYKNDEKRIVYGPVLVPDEPDTDNDVVSAEKIEEVAHKFMEEYGNIDLMHSLNNVGKVVESYILPFDWEIDDEITIPKGSWMMGVRVTDDDAWQAVKDGRLSGFSIMAMQKIAMKSSEKKQKSKRVTLADLGDDWIVNAVSLVDEPAVPKAKWIAIKSKNKNTINIDNNIVQKAIEGSLEHRKQLLEAKLRKMLAEYDTYFYIYATMDDEIIVKIVEDEGNSKYFKIKYQIDDEGTVEFTSDPKEVVIEENIIDVGGDGEEREGSEEDPEVDQDDPVDEEDPDNDETDEETEIVDDEEEQMKQNKKRKRFMSRFMESIGVRSKSSKKSGRIISETDYQKLKEAKKVIDSLLSVAEKECQASSEKGVDEMKKEDVQQTIDEINSKLDDVLNVLKMEAKGKGLEHEEKDKQGSEKGKGEEQDEFKEKYEAILKELKNRPFSHRLAGQDEDVTKSKGDEEELDDRNAFGFKVK